MTTVDEVRERVRAIAACVDDDETAHGMEDDLHQGVLESIAEGTATDPAGMALEALTTRALKFARWCA